MSTEAAWMHTVCQLNSMFILGMGAYPRPSTLTTGKMLGKLDLGLNKHHWFGISLGWELLQSLVSKITPHFCISDCSGFPPTIFYISRWMIFYVFCRLIPIAHLEETNISPQLVLNYFPFMAFFKNKGLHLDLSPFCMWFLLIHWQNSTFDSYNLNEGGETQGICHLLKQFHSTT